MEEILEMAKVEWIKLTVDMFDNKKIKHIRKLPEGNNIVLIWVMLLTMAGRCNSNGFIFLTENIPYTNKMLADELGFDENVIQIALNALERFDMISRNGDLLSIPGWEEHQNIEGLEKIREQTRTRVAEYRKRQRQRLAKSEQDVDCIEEPVTLSNVTVTEQNKKRERDKERDIERDREGDVEEEKEEKNISTVSKDTVCRTNVRRIIEKWNTLSEFGVRPVKKVGSNTKIFERLCARIREYGIDDVLTAIDIVKNSDFLLGRVKDFVITLDWFSRPNNFQKIYNGNYDNANRKNRYQSQTAQMLDSFYSQTEEWVRKMEQEEQENDG